MTRINFTQASIAKLPAATTPPQDLYWAEGEPGLGVVVGRSVDGRPPIKTFIVRARIKTGEQEGDQVKVKIGVFGDVRPEGDRWTVQHARNAAERIKGELAKGINPNVAKRKPVPVVKTGGPTVREAMQAHLDRQRATDCRPRTIETFEREIKKYLAEYLDQPLLLLKGKGVLASLHKSIMASAKPRAKSNPANPVGAALANRVATQVSAVWNTWNDKHEGELGDWNPIDSVDRITLHPKRVRVAEADLPAYYQNLLTMRNQLNRDGLLIELYTALRSESVRTIRWEDVDLVAGTLHIPRPKGGESVAFWLPLTTTTIEIFTRRKIENARLHHIATAGGDNGFVFPTVNDEGKVVAITGLRESRRVAVGDSWKKFRFPVEDEHTLRRTWRSIAGEEGIPEDVRHILMNHSWSKRSVSDTYDKPEIERLRVHAQKVDDGITRRLGKI